MSINQQPFDPTHPVDRLAPACVCNVASRVLWLRAKLNDPNVKIDLTTRALLAPFVARLPFEEELLSGNSERVRQAIDQIGALDSELPAIKDVRGIFLRAKTPSPHQTDEL